jgi:hypothetical protein
VEQFGHLGHQVLRRGAPDGLAGHQDDVSVIRMRRDLSPGRTKDPPGSVPLDRTADPARGHDRGLSRTGRDKQYHPPSVQAGARLQHGSHPWRVHGLPGEAGAALGTAARQDRASGARAHPMAEAMGLGAAAGVGLERTLGHAWGLSKRIGEVATRPAGARDSIRAAVVAGQRA